jgi:hypothetical protein
MSSDRKRLTPEELEAEGSEALPDKEVMSVPLLDLNVDADLALALAAPVDLAVAGNLNVAAPIDAAASANVLSAGSTAAGVANQDVVIDQLIEGDAVADANQEATVDQTADETGAATPAADSTEPVQPTAEGETAAPADAPAAPTEPVTGAAQPVGEAVQPVSDAVAPAAGAEVPSTGGATDAVTGAIGGVDPQETVEGALGAGLVNVDANIALDADLAAPIAGAVAVNANVAAPIDAAVAANIGSIDSEAVAIADQKAAITQHIEGDASATADQDADVEQ